MLVGTTGDPYAERQMRVCFVLGRLGPSGGVRSVLTHARGLAAAHDMDVTIAVSEGPAEAADGVEVVTLDDARGREFDIAIATWWRTAYSLFELRAARRVYFIQNFEERLYRPGDVERLGAAITRDLPVAFVTEASWIADELAELRPDARCFHVPNGIDKALFAPPDAPPERAPGPFRILLEGSTRLWFKGGDDAIEVLGAMREPFDARLVSPERPLPEQALPLEDFAGPLPHEEMPARYAAADVLLKLSRVEGVFTPPLEAFHCGTTAVVWPVTGHDEYIEHGVNAIVAGWDDIAGTARWLDLLATDRELLARLREGALETARAWPSWEEATARMASALQAIADAPPPAAETGVSDLLNDVHAGMEELRVDQRRRLIDTERADFALADERRARTEAEQKAARLEQELASTLGARARRLLASVRR
jgi:glycosyltransferase involved in cell wall biosynthesis